MVSDASAMGRAARRHHSQLRRPYSRLLLLRERWLWRRCYRLRNRYHSLEDTLRYQQLFGYAEERLVRYPVVAD